MNHSGDAAEQIVRMSLEGMEVAAKITGTAAKEIAAFLVAALKSNNKNGKLKLKGKARMASMLKSGKALEIFSVKERDLPKFAQGAKQYGIVYCVLRNRKNTPDGLCDIMVKADDAPKISRVVERFKFATVDKAKIESEIVKGKAEKAQGAEQQTGAEPEAPDRNDTEKLLDDLMGTEEGKTAPDQPEVDKTDAAKTAPPALAKDVPQKNPGSARATKPRPSEPTSESRSKSARGTSSKPSVKDEIREIKAEFAKKEADAPMRDERQTSDRQKSRRLPVLAALIIGKIITVLSGAVRPLSSFWNPMSTPKRTVHREQATMSKEFLIFHRWIRASSVSPRRPITPSGKY